MIGLFGGKPAPAHVPNHVRNQAMTRKADITEQLHAMANDMLEPYRRLTLEAHTEIERLREFARWVQDHSNDPGVVLKARAALEPKP